MAKNNTDVVAQVRTLLQTMPDQLKVEVLENRKEEIKRISENCKKDPLYRRTLGAQYDFYKPLKAVPRDKALLMCWVHFLDRMQNAPTKAHMRGVVILCFPILADILRHKENFR